MVFLDYPTSIFSSSFFFLTIGNEKYTSVKTIHDV